MYRLYFASRSSPVLDHPVFWYRRVNISSSPYDIVCVRCCPAGNKPVVFKHFICILLILYLWVNISCYFNEIWLLLIFFFSGCSLPSRSPLYSWVGNTPKVRFTGSGSSSAAGFRIGGTTQKQYLFLEIHYMHASSIPDQSGISIHTTSGPKSA